MDLHIAEMLIAHGASLDVQDSVGDTLLHNAVSGGKLCITEMLIDSGAPIDAKDNDGNTPLHMAIEQNVDFVELLCSRGADVNARNNSNFTPLQRAYDIFVPDQVPTEVVKKTVV